MPEVLGNPPSPRTALFWNGTAWQWALVDAAGNLQIDVVASGLPVGAATAAAQALALAQLQLIEDMRDALQSVATDRLIVRGEDQLHSYRAALVSSRAAVISGAGGYVDSHAPGAGEVWVVTNIRACNNTTATTVHLYYHRIGVTNYIFDEVRRAMGVGEGSLFHHWLWMPTLAIVRVYFTGGLAGDSCEVSLTGHVMTLET